MKKTNRLGSSVILIIAIVTALTILSGCAPRIHVNPSVPDIVLVGTTPTNPNPDTPTPPGIADAHFVQPDDFFITEEPYTGQGWIYARIAKMITAPTEETKQQAQFLVTMDGSTVWTKNYKRTRIATRADLVLNREVIIFDVMDSNGHYRSPENNQEARAGWWFNTKIVDISELFKNIIMVVDGYKVKETAVRVIVQ